MRIAFNLVKCGLGNNGGSQTIIRMALALQRLGHDVKILLNFPNRFTWFNFNQEIISLNPNYVDTDIWPQFDVMIATACSTVWDVVNYPLLPVEKKFYWIRGFENWAMTEGELLEGYRSGLNLLVNSEWQKENIFKLTGINSRIQYSGLPINEIYSFDENDFCRPSEIIDKVRIGSIYSKKAHKGFPLFESVISKLLKKSEVEKVYTFGDTYLGNVRYADVNVVKFEHLIKPTMKEKVEMIKKCDIWVSTSINDGCHIPPMEAGLCGCNLVVNGELSSGVRDYAIEGVTAKTYFTPYEAVERIEEYMKDPVEQHTHSENLKYILKMKIGSIDTNARKFERILQNN